MLGRAKQQYEARPQAQQKKTESRKPPFLSSSPAANQNTNIAQSFSQSHKSNTYRSGPSQQFHAPPRFAGFANYDKSSSSLSTQSTTYSIATSRESVSTAASSVYSSANGSPRPFGPPALFKKPEESFAEPQVIDLTTDRGTSTTLKDPVWFDENDFSDDPDLEFEIPATLPPAPEPVPVPSPTPVEIPWSTSPPSNWEPKNKNAQSLKRQSPPDLVSSPVPVPKKRALPGGWTSKDNKPTATPAPKKEDKALWNQTYSAVKDQKRQHRSHTQKKKTGEPNGSNGHSTTDTLDVKTSKSKANKAKNEPFSLSKEQAHVLDLVVNKNQSVFFTGPAGTGKSVLMRAIIAELKKKWQRDPERLGVTASTGLAACNIGGMTLHSFSGIGLGKEDAASLVKKIRRNPKAKQRWLRTRTLIIDEISMVDGELFDKLSHIGRTIRNNGRPWGGIQLVITGDFFQLPPVPEGFENKKKEVKFAFEAATWTTSIDHTIGLTEVFRQKDPEFAEMLNEMRLGKISERTVRAFKSMSRDIRFDDGLEMTELFPTRAEVDGSNRRRLQALPGSPYPYEAADGGQVDIKFRERLLSNMMAPKSLELKKGAQVMLIKNIDDTLVNGSIGKIVDFKTEDEFLVMNKETDNSEAEEDWGLDGKAKKRIAAFRNDLANPGGQSTKGTKYPIVEFGALDGNPRQIFVLPEDWKVELPTGEVQASRKQLPLILAWALSIHKAQGQTLERVKVNLGKVFEKGQAYVALSRATTQHGLQVLGFEKHKVMAHPKVVTFYNQLYSAEQAASKKTSGTLKEFMNKMTTQAPPPKPAPLSKSMTNAGSSYGRHEDPIGFEDEEELLASGW